LLAVTRYDIEENFVRYVTSELLKVTITIYVAGHFHFQTRQVLLTVFVSILS